MAVVGIIAEFNPLHTGHEYLINEARKIGTVVCIISGNFVQRGDTAIVDKRVRAEAALRCGADIVLELPVLWSMSTAQNFALGGVSALYYAGCDTLMFGSECGDTKELIKTTRILSEANFKEKLEKYLSRGVTFAAARQAAGEECGVGAEILSKPNNNLAIEYITAANSLGADLRFETVKRKGAAHDSNEVAEFVSASLLREKLRQQDIKFCENYIPKQILPLLSNDKISDIKRIETAVLASLRIKSKDELAALPDLSEGIENKLYNASRLATNLDELYNMIKSKRYTLARIRRLALSAFIGMDNSFFMKPVPYIRVLGLNKKGEEFLRQRLSKSTVPVIMRASEADTLPKSAQKVFKTECRATDLYALSLSKPLECGLEYTSKLIKTE